MGLRDILTKPLFQSAEFSWREPMLHRPRLRGDLIFRVIFVFACWSGGTGVLLALFAINRNPPPIAVGLFLGFVFGGGPGMMYAFFSRSQTAGQVKVDEDGILRTITYPGFAVMTTEPQEFLFDEIDRCVFVDGEELGTSFSILLIDFARDWHMVAVPARIDPEELAEYIEECGVRVKRGRQIPDELIEPMSPIPVVVMSLFGIPMLFAGTALYLSNVL